MPKQMNLSFPVQLTHPPNVSPLYYSKDKYPLRFRIFVFLSLSFQEVFNE